MRKHATINQNVFTPGMSRTCVACVAVASDEREVAGLVRHMPVRQHRLVDLYTDQVIKHDNLS